MHLSSLLTRCSGPPQRLCYIASLAQPRPLNHLGILAHNVSSLVSPLSPTRPWCTPSRHVSNPTLQRSRHHHPPHPATLPTPTTPFLRPRTPLYVTRPPARRPNALQRLHPLHPHRRVLAASSQTAAYSANNLPLRPWHARE